MEITGRLRQSLHNAVRLTLGMERRDDAVSLPWEAMWYRPEKPPQPLPAGTRVSEIFQKTKQQLLILGEPGAGKTTTMLELARDLLEKAKADNTQPIPVLVSLSSWKAAGGGFFRVVGGGTEGEVRVAAGYRQSVDAEWNIAAVTGWVG